MKNRLVRFLLTAFIGTFTTVASAAPDSLLTVLTKDDPTPPRKSLITQQSFTGNNPAADCAYYELLQSAKSTARKLGANVLKINSHKKRSQQQFCDEIGISFYKVEDVSAIEQHFPWTADRKLVWADFKGPVPSSAFATNAAVTSCGIAIETNTVTNNNPVKVYVFNSFETSTSWVRPEQQKPEILEHEQGHFDLCELYTRKMRERFSTASINVKNLQQVVQGIYNKVMQEYSDRQQDYERETQHGLVETAQKSWTVKIAKELDATESWASR